MLTLKFYTIYLIIIPLIALLISQKKKYHFIPFLIIAILGLIRYDTTTDYSAYVTGFWDIRNNNYSGWFEPGYVLLNQIFSFSKWGFIPVLMISIFVPYIQIYKLFKKYDIVLIGTLLFLFLGYITRFENIVRQGLALGIFYFSFKYIEQGKFVKYLLMTALAASIHLSAIMFIPYYFLIKYVSIKKPPVLFSGLILLILYILTMSGATATFLSILLKDVPFYTVYTENLEIGKLSLGLTLLFNTFIAWLPIIFVDKNNKNYWRVINLSWISAGGFILVQNFIVVNRIFEYLYIFQIIAISLMLKKMFYQKIRAVAVTLLLMMFVLHVRRDLFYYGNNIYNTIFSQKSMEHKFYKRHHKWVKHYKPEDNVDRSKEIKKYPN